MDKRIICLLVAVLLAAAAVSSLAEPLVYRITGPEGTALYLMGTVHVGRKTDGIPEAAEKALEECGALALEVDPREMTAVNPAFLRQAARLFLPAGTRLSDLVGEELVQKCASALGMRQNSLEMLVPYAAVALLNERDYASLSLEEDYGTEKLLEDTARRLGLRVTGIETVEEQMDVLLSLDDAYCAGLMEEETEAPEACREEIRRLYELWQAGDEKGLEALLAAEAGLEDPAYAEAARLLVTDRNRRFAEAARAFLSGGETVFMAVGCGHLYGEEGLLTLLEAEGCAVVKLNAAPEAGTLSSAE